MQDNLCACVCCYTSGMPLVWHNTAKVPIAKAKSSGNDASSANTSAPRSATPTAACSKLPLKESALKATWSEGDWRTWVKLRAGVGVDSADQPSAGSSHCWPWALAVAGGGAAVASRVDAKVRASGTRRWAGAAMCRARLDRSSPAKHA